MGKPEETTRIAQQYRDRMRGMVYELTCGTDSLVLRSLQSADSSAAEWRFEAHPMHAPQLIVIGDWKSSRDTAFGAVRDLWIEKAVSLGLARLDWDAVAKALTLVRALG